MLDRMEMQYRYLGRSGLQVSVLSFGSWVSFGPQLDGDSARDCLAAAYENGVNFFDNAEAYARGKSETIMGAAIKELGWPRYSYVISSKYFWGIEGSVNMRNTLNRKYLMHAVDRSLGRLQLEHLDLIFCHRPDQHTPVEETVWAMHDIITSGRALYWGTSEWTADSVREAYDIADRHHLHKPLMEQLQYNLFERDKVEQEFAQLFHIIGLGLTVWSPLASGLLSGKYVDDIPEGSRATLKGYEWLRDMVTDPDRNQKVRELKEIADGLGATLSQLSIAWCAKNENVSTVITGASRVAQVRENLGALDVMARLTPDVMARIDAIFTRS